MSIVVNGMEMPTEAQIAGSTDIDCCVSAVTNFKKGDARPKGCPLVAAPEWISVEERLPEEYVSLLVCFDFKGRKRVDVAELWPDGKFHNYSDEHLTPEGRKYRRATHWMPLPEPPKECK